MNLRFDEWRLFIGGEWIATKSVDDIRLPYDGTVVGKVHAADPALVHCAIDAAQRSLRAMREMSLVDRGDLLFRLHGILKERLPELGETVCIETGKPIREARMEAEASVQVLLDIAAEARSGEVETRIEKSRTVMRIREPRGVVALVTAFYDPLRLAVENVASALAGGNTVVHYPAAQTPFSALLLAAALEKAGLPKGTFNVVCGAEVARVLADDPAIDARIHPAPEGATAFIVEPDADVDAVVAAALPAAFCHSGQMNSPLQEIYVHEDLAAPLLQRLSDKAARLRIAHPFEQGSELSSLISEEAAAHVTEWMDEARAHGARPLTGGQRRAATVRPSVIENIPEDCQRSRAGRRGPAISVCRYMDMDDSIARVECNRAVVFTSDLQLAFRAARRLHCDSVGLNQMPGATRNPRRRIEDTTKPKTISWPNL